MDELLTDLQILLEKHHAVILRSADENNKLVLSCAGSDKALEFEEEISEYSLKYNWHEIKD